MHLTIGNKLYSSWSMRPWILMRALEIPFTETVVPLDTPQFRDAVGKLGVAGRVPVLQDGDVTVWETLAIMEYVAERHPQAGVWPKDAPARAHARAAASEMHAGFSALRSACPMNLGKRYASRDRGEGVAKDVARIEALWREARTRFGSPAGGAFLYGAFCAADAMFAPVVTRLDTYGITVAADTRAYMDAVLSLSAFREWLAAGLEEPWIVADDEVDEAPIEVLRRL